MKKVISIINPALLFIFVVFASGCLGTERGEPIVLNNSVKFNLEYSPAPPDNPLKGFVPMVHYSNIDTFPHSMEFIYIPLKDIQYGNNSFDWTSLENKINKITQKGCQAIFRIYIDYPNREIGLPDFLMQIDKQVYTDYNNGTKNTSYSPDYNNPLLKQSLKNLISELGNKYDGDPRIAFIQMGLIGFWGEWHTYPHTEWMASTETMTEILDSFTMAFKKTFILAREPKDGIDFERIKLGFHDDSFVFDTIGNKSWYFGNLLEKAGLGKAWTAHPIGGEIYPPLQADIWKGMPDDSLENEYYKCIDATHASFMLYQYVFSKLDEKEYIKAQNGARKLGYEIYVKEAEIVYEGKTKLKIKMSNNGVAPFYYQWEIFIGILDNDGGSKEYNTMWDIRNVKPQSNDCVFEYEFGKDIIKKGNKIMVSVKNPMTNGKLFRFANKLQDANKVGWLTLGIY